MPPIVHNYSAIAARLRERQLELPLEQTPATPKKLESFAPGDPCPECGTQLEASGTLVKCPSCRRFQLTKGVG
jgi:tRNA(Ile2) C34 agmatinyltransferase TiaS